MRRIRWGLIGCGDIAAKRVAPALKELSDCELLAVCRRNKELVTHFAREFGVKRWYTDWRELVADPDVDAVYVATPVYLHAEQTITAAENGKQVLCEKPMAMNVQESDRMIAACRRKNVELGVAYYRHFYPAVERMRKIIHSGEIGQPVVAQINAFERFNPPPQDPRYWILLKERAGGGPMFDFGCHRVEVILYLLGRVSRVTSSIGRVLYYDREVEDTAVASFEMENGARSTLTVTHASFESQDTFHVFGSEGSIHVPVLNQGVLRIVSSSGERQECHPPHRNPHLPLIEDFVEAIRDDGHQPAVDGETGRQVAAIMEQIYTRAS